MGSWLCPGVPTWGGCSRWVGAGFRGSQEYTGAGGPRLVVGGLCIGDGPGCLRRALDRIFGFRGTPLWVRMRRGVEHALSAPNSRVCKSGK